MADRLRPAAVRGRRVVAMAGYLVSEDVWERVAPLLPTRPVSEKGGRPQVGDREVLTGIIFILKTGIPWDELPKELGCGCGMTCLRRIRFWRQRGAWPMILSIVEERLRGVKGVNWARLRTPAADEDAAAGRQRASHRSSGGGIHLAGQPSNPVSEGRDDMLARPGGMVVERRLTRAVNEAQAPSCTSEG